VALVETDISERHTTSIFRLKILFSHEDAGNTFLRNVGSYKVYTGPYPKRQHSSDIVWLKKEPFQ
jgi:hypothetical protein